MRQVKEVNVSLHVPSCEQFYTERFRGNFFFQLEVALIGEVVAAASLVIRRTCLFSCCFSGVFLEHILFGAGDKLILLLCFSLFCDLSNPSVRVEYRLQFHI